MTTMLQGRRGFRSLLTLIALAGAVTTASADPIPITVISGVIEFEGSLVGPENLGRLTLTGTDGFLMSAEGNAVAASCIACGPGEVDLSVGVFANFGSITHQGATREFSFPDTPRGGELFARAGVVVLPPVRSSEVLLFQTAFSLDPSNSIVGTPEQMFQLSGSGVGEARFVEADGVWFFETLRLDFNDQAPVPEPSTVLLVGGAVAGLWLRRRTGFEGSK